MQLNIEGSSLLLEITLDSEDGRKVFRMLQQDGGEWRLKPGDGSPGATIAGKRIGLAEALKRALLAMSEDVGLKGSFQ